MKIGIITHYDVHNHGAVLQMYALEKVLENFENEVRGLTFHKNYDFLESYAENKYNISLKSIPYYIGYLFEKGFKKTYFNYKKKQILDNFKSSNKMIGEKSSEAKNLDMVFIGSDEVFSIEAGLTPEFWGNNIDCKNIFSYAGCFGPTTLEFIKEKNAEEFIKNGINNLKDISVRDENSKNIIETLSDRKCFGPTTLEFIKEKNAEEFIKNGINNLKDISVRDENSKNIIETLSDRKAILVCDPVILYGYIKEKENFNKKFNEKYILVYSYDNNMNKENEINNIKNFAKEHDCKIYSVGFYHEWCDKNINCDPIELLEYIRNAEYVLTDTFHGTVMSLIMNTQFVGFYHEWCDKNINCDPIELLEYIRNAEYVLTDTFHGTVMSLIMNTQFVTKVHTNSNKLGFLLKEYRCTDRITKDFLDTEKIILNKIDYEKVNEIIKERREVSMNYIKNCLEKVENEK